MKKVLLLILCLLLFLAGCSASGKPAPSVTPDCGVYVGMPTEEFWKLYDNEDVKSMAGFPGVDEDYYFIEDANGNPVVLTLENIDRKYTITAIAAFDKNKIELSTRSYFSIKAGMTMQELISIVGHPLGCFNAAGDRLTWKVDDTMFHVTFRTRSGDPSILVVEDVVLMDEDGSKSIINHKYIPFID